MPEVDYQRTDVARRYSQGRELPDDVLDRWGAAVRPHLPSRPGLRVLDLGAGTGIFARAWPSWTSCEVVAVEPAAGMRAELAEQRDRWARGRRRRAGPSRSRSGRGLSTWPGSRRSSTT